VIKKTFGLVVVILFASSASAVVLLNDPFDYTNGPLVTVSGGKWTHYSGATTGQVQVIGGRIALNGSDTEDVNSLLAGQPYDSAGTTNRFYAGFTVRFTALPGASGTYFAIFKDSSATGFRARVWAFTAGAAPGKFRLGLSSASGSVITATNPADLSLNTDYTVVIRLVNSNSAAKLWLNPGAESDASISTGDEAASFTVVAYAFRQSSGAGNLSIDDLRVGSAFTDIITNAPALSGPAITSPPQNQSVSEGGTAVFNVGADGTPVPGYQWQFNGIALPGATNSALVLTNVSFDKAGSYSVTVSNVIDTANSGPVVLNVFSTSAPAFSLLTYNAHGNGVLNWSTNTAHVQAIGRQMQFLNPDIITFQEIPVTNNGTAQMTNFAAAFRPGFYLATNSADDGFIRSVILSRYPIVSSQSRLHASSLAAFGYTNSGFTRDLFEAEILVPGLAQPLHVFTVHLKSGQDTDAATKRAAEAGAISNFLVAGYLTTNALQPYVLTGDLNEDIQRPPASDPQSVQRLIDPSTGLRLTTPFNPFDHSELTFSIQSTGGLEHRYDYILPGALLFSNATGSQVFRTDRLSPLPPNLNSNDDRIASDHLPVLMFFANPYDRPFRLLSIARSPSNVSLTWQSVPGQLYQVQGSTNLAVWTTLVSNLTATGSVLGFATNLAESVRYFRVRRDP
jgi:endonuclease/exonuclease/phosphatase family metal-dependent hydrolase